MRLTDIISLVILSMYSLVLLRKVRSLGKQGTHATALLKGKKTLTPKVAEASVLSFSYPLLFLWFTETFSLFKESRLHAFWPLEVIGLVSMTVGALIYSIAIITLGNAWRIGIETENNQLLVTHGIYRFSRNPAYMGYMVMFLGITLVYTTLFTLILTPFAIGSLLFMAFMESKCLLKTYGKVYQEYADKTRFF